MAFTAFGFSELNLVLRHNRAPKNITDLTVLIQNATFATLVFNNLFYADVPQNSPRTGLFSVLVFL